MTCSSLSKKNIRHIVILSIIVNVIPSGELEVWKLLNLQMFWQIMVQMVYGIIEKWHFRNSPFSTLTKHAWKHLGIWDVQSHTVIKTRSTSIRNPSSDSVSALNSSKLTQQTPDLHLFECSSHSFIDFSQRPCSLHLYDQVVKQSFFHLDLEDSFTKALMQIRVNYGQTVFEVNRVIGGRLRVRNWGRTQRASVGQRSKQPALCDEYQ